MKTMYNYLHSQLPQVQNHFPDSTNNTQTTAAVWGRGGGGKRENQAVLNLPDSTNNPRQQLDWGHQAIPLASQLK